MTCIQKHHGSTVPADKGQERKDGLAFRRKYGIWKPMIESSFAERFPL